VQRPGTLAPPPSAFGQVAAVTAAQDTASEDPLHAAARSVRLPPPAK
jgi:hypothetical protein